MIKNKTALLLAPKGLIVIAIILLVVFLGFRFQQPASFATSVSAYTCNLDENNCYFNLETSKRFPSGSQAGWIGFEQEHFIFDGRKYALPGGIFIQDIDKTTCNDIGGKYHELVLSEDGLRRKEICWIGEVLDRQFREGDFEYIQKSFPIKKITDGGVELEGKLYEDYNGISLVFNIDIFDEEEEIIIPIETEEIPIDPETQEPVATTEVQVKKLNIIDRIVFGIRDFFLNIIDWFKG